MNLVIFGPPGAGKGTQSKFISNKFNLHQLSTGELLRIEIKNQTVLGSKISSIMNSGDLVSDEIVTTLIEKYISQNTYKNRLIFDGYPRNLNQAINLDKLLKKYDQKIDLVLNLSVKLETIKKRILERKSQEKRADDNEVVAIKRFKNYESSTKPVLDYYNKSNLLKDVNGEASITEINVEISGIIESIKGWLWMITQYKYAGNLISLNIWLG